MTTNNKHAETAAFALCIIVFIISNVIFMPIEIYYTFRLYKRRHSLIIAKRKPTLIVIGVSLASGFFVMNTIYALWSFEDHGTVHTQWFIPIFIPIAMAAWYLYILRLWILFYQINFNIETIAMKWQTIINPSKAKRKWYHSHKQMLGNWKSLVVILILYEVLTLLIVMALIFIVLYAPYTPEWDKAFATIHWIFAVIALYIPLILIIFISCKVPTHYDNIGLTKEVKITGYCFVAIVITTSIIDGLLMEYITFNHIDSPNHQALDLLYLCTVLLWRVSFFIACMIQTRYPINTFGPILDRYTTNSAVRIAHKATLEELKTINTDCLNEPKSMKTVLNNDESFDLFIKHCSNEHCLECILSVIEFLEFKNKLYEIIENDDDQNMEDIDDEKEKYLILPPSCPQSIIVNNDKMSNKLIARALYLKYIRVGATFEINLASSDRKKYWRLMENERIWLNEHKYDSDVALFSLFDLCIMEMCSLLTAAFSRYKQSNQYQILVGHNVT